MSLLTRLGRWITCALFGAMLLVACPARKAVHAAPAVESVGRAELGGAGLASGSGWSLRLLGEQRIAHRLMFDGTTVGGLSGIDYDPETGLFYLISDDRSERSPARFYSATLDISADGFKGIALHTAVALRKPDGRTYPAQPADDAVDPEAIRYDPRTKTLLWTSEGERLIGPLDKRFFTQRLIDPSVREAALNGNHVTELPLPAMFRMQAKQRGPRSNLSFEGLSLSPDGRSVWVSMEGPLYEDGDVPNVNAGALVRITRLARSPVTQPGLLAQYAYRTEPLPHRPLVPGAIGDQGVAEILAISDERLLVLERAYSLGRGITLRLFEADTRDASDVREQASLQQASITAMKKTLVLDFATLGLPHLDNVEGMSWGPTLANGHRTLVFVSDDNFNPLQKTQLFAFEVLRSPPVR